ncbi:MAG: hypothetical protein WC184_06460 [Acidimicrobiia bacterium]
MSLRELHGIWAWVVVLSNAAAGVWALGAHWVPALRQRAMWWFTIAAEIAIFIQVVLGVALISIKGAEVAQFHVFYGFVAAITVGLIYSYKAQIDPWRYLLYGFGGLFLMGLAIRAMTIGV